MRIVVFSDQQRVIAKGNNPCLAIISSKSVTRKRESKLRATCDSQQVRRVERGHRIPCLNQSGRARRSQAHLCAAQVALDLGGSRGVFQWASSGRGTRM